MTGCRRIISALSVKTIKSPGARRSSFRSMPAVPEATPVSSHGAHSTVIEKAVVAVVLSSLLHPAFQWVATISSARALPPPAWMVIFLDRGLPVLPEAVWIYVSWYPASAVLGLARRDTLRRGYLAIVVSFAICIVCHLAFPYTIERPPLSGSSASVTLLAFVYANDRPVNLLPSFHAALAAVLFRLRPASRVVSAAALTWTTAVSISCVLTKQHYIIDVVGGLIVGAIAVTIVDLTRWARH